MDIGPVLRGDEIGLEALALQRFIDGHLHHQWLQLSHQQVEGLLMVVQGRCFDGQGATNRNAGLRQIQDPFQDCVGHGLAVRPQDQDLVFHTRLCLEMSVDGKYRTQQAVRVDEVVGIAVRNGRKFVTEQAGDAVVLAVIIEDIGLIATLLEHKRTPGQVVGPYLRLLRPGLVAVEPLAVTDQVQSGPVAIVRLGGRLVDDKAVQAAGKGHVGRIFQRFRAVGIGFSSGAAGREGLGRNEVLPEDMGHGGGFADVGHGHRDGGTGRGVMDPDGGHGDVGFALEVHAVAHILVAVLVGLRVKPFHPSLLDEISQAVVILGEKFAQGPPPVKEEPFGLLRAIEDLSGKGGKPGEQVVAASLLEFPHHVAGPGHLSGLVTVCKKVLYGSSFINLEKLLEIALPGLRIQFVHLQAGGLGRSRMVLLAGQGGTEPVDAPASGRDLPDERPVLVDETEVLDHRHRIFRIRREEIGEIVGRGKARLVLGVIHLDYAMQDEFRHLPVSLHDQAEMPGMGGRNVHRHHRETGGGDVAHFPPGDSVVAGFQTIVVSGRVRSPLVPPVAAAERNGTDELRMIEGIGDPTGPVCPGLQLAGIGKIAVGELPDREIPAGGSHARAHFLHRFLRIGKSDGQRGDMLEPGIGFPIIGDVLVPARCPVEFRHVQHLETGAGHFQGSPRELFHGVGGLHPRTARGTPARRGRHRRLHALRIGQLHGIPEGDLPARRAVRHGFGHDGLHTDPAGIELVEAADPGPFHPFDILLDTVDGHVPVHPVPPHPRPRLLRRIRKSLIERSLRLRAHGGKQGRQYGSPSFHRQAALFREFLTRAPGLSDDFADGAVGHGSGVENDGLELLQVHLSVRQDALVGTHVHDLANEDAVGPTHDLALEGEGVLIDNRSVHVGAGRHGETDLRDLVGNLVAADEAEVIGLRHGADIGKTHGEGAGQFDIVGGLVLGHRDHDLLVVVLAGPRRHHHVRGMVLVPRRDHHARLRRRYERMVRSEILPARHFLKGFIGIHFVLCLIVGTVATDGHQAHGDGQENDLFHIANITIIRLGFAVSGNKLTL